MSSDGRESGRGMRRPPLPRASDIPVVSDVQASWARFTDPDAKLRRRMRRTSRGLTLWLLLTGICALLAVTGFFGLTSGVGGWTGALNWVIATAVFATLSWRSGARLRALKRSEFSHSRKPAPLPPSGSRAREPMKRLAESESSLTELLGQLDQPNTAAAEISCEQTRSTADDAASALRALAARIQAVERARASTPAGEQGALDSAVGQLGEQLDEGLDGYGSLVAAAGRAVAASSTGLAPAQEALTDATEHLAGLAIALRELSRGSS